MTEDFLSPRRCFLVRIPEVDRAADLLSQAADRLLAGDAGQARELLMQADFPALRSFAASAMSQVTIEIHRLRDVPDLPPSLAMTERGRRAPPAAERAALFRRDGYRCRYCACRIVLPEAQNVLSKALPGAVTWGNTDREMNAAFYTLKGVLDHVVPHAHGGGSGPENLVTSCQPCNYGKGNWFIEQVGLQDPRQNEPVVDEWDGLGRLLSTRPVGVSDLPPSRSAPAVEALPASGTKSRRQTKAISVEAWLAELSDADRVWARKLLDVLESCRDLGLSWTMREILSVQVTVGGTLLTILGVLKDGEVQVPWYVADQKAATRSFAEVLAASIPGAECYETLKMWRVRKGGRQLRLSELMQARSGLRLAFEALRNAVQ